MTFLVLVCARTFTENKKEQKIVRKVVKNIFLMPYIIEYNSFFQFSCKLIRDVNL